MHSDEIAGATVSMGTQVSGKVVELVSDLIAKLLKAMGENSQTVDDKFKKLDLKERKQDIKANKPGQVPFKDLVASAKRGNANILSQNGFDKEQAKFVTKRAKELGISVSFTGSEKNNTLTCHIRETDKQILEQINTEYIKGKLDQNPQEYAVFKADKWQSGGLDTELNNLDIPRNWATNKDGELVCIFEKKYEGAVKQAQQEFAKKCTEIEQDLSISKDKDGFTVIIDKASGREISFDNMQTQEMLAHNLEQQFGYDPVKANLAAAKYGQENLNGAEKDQFFANPPELACEEIRGNIQLQNENPVCAEFNCIEVTPKIDGEKRIVFSDENNNFAVIDLNMTRKEMTEAINKGFYGQLSPETVTALVDKAERVNNALVAENTENLAMEYETNFDTNEISNQEYATEKIVCDINRTSTNTFTVKSEQIDNENGVTLDQQELTLSFSDKKTSVNSLAKMFEEQGMSKAAAKQQAEIVFDKAKAQSADKIFVTEPPRRVPIQDTDTIIGVEKGVDDRIDGETYGKPAVKITDGTKTAYLTNLENKEQAVEQLQEKFGITKEQAEKVYGKAEEKLKELGVKRQENTQANAQSNTNTPPTATHGNGHENRTPTPNNNTPTVPHTPTNTTGTGGRGGRH
jgi:hypothetical protein